MAVSLKMMRLWPLPASPSPALRPFGVGDTEPSPPLPEGYKPHTLHPVPRPQASPRPQPCPRISQLPPPHLRGTLRGPTGTRSCWDANQTPTNTCDPRGPALPLCSSLLQPHGPPARPPDAAASASGPRHTPPVSCPCNTPLLPRASDADVVSTVIAGSSPMQ